MRTRLLVFLLLSILGIRSAQAWTVKLTEDELQARINRSLPIEKKGLLLSVVVSSIDVELQEGHDRVGLNTAMEIKLPGYSTGKGEAYLEGRPVYSPDDGAFYFAEPEVKDIKFENIPDKYYGTVKKVLQLAVQRRLGKTPIYTLDSNKTKHQLARTLLKSVSVRDKKLVLELGLF